MLCACGRVDVCARALDACATLICVPVRTHAFALALVHVSMKPDLANSLHVVDGFRYVAIVPRIEGRVRVLDEIHRVLQAMGAGGWGSEMGSAAATLA